MSVNTGIKDNTINCGIHHSRRRDKHLCPTLCRTRAGVGSSKISSPAGPRSSKGTDTDLGKGEEDEEEDFTHSGGEVATNSWKIYAVRKQANLCYLSTTIVISPRDLRWWQGNSNPGEHDRPRVCRRRVPTSTISLRTAPPPLHIGQLGPRCRARG